MIKVTVWNENYHEKINPLVAKNYPDGIHNAIADGEVVTRTSTQDQEEYG